LSPLDRDPAGISHLGGLVLIKKTLFLKHSLKNKKTRPCVGTSFTRDTTLLLQNSQVTNLQRSYNVPTYAFLLTAESRQSLVFTSALLLGEDFH
jgi:hypothetical protein